MLFSKATRQFLPLIHNTCLQDVCKSINRNTCFMSYDIVYSLSYYRRNETHFMKTVYLYYPKSSNQMTKGGMKISYFSPQSLSFIIKIRHKTQGWIWRSFEWWRGTILFTQSAWKTLIYNTKLLERSTHCPFLDPPLIRHLVMQR